MKISLVQHATRGGCVIAIVDTDGIHNASQDQLLELLADSTSAAN
jgi:hypothetical protein